MKRKLLIVGVLTFALSLNGYAANAMGIYVQLISNKFIVVDVEPEDTIIGVKAKIFDSEGIPIENQYLFFDDLLLENDKELWEYNIQKESRLILRPDPRIAENSDRAAREALAARQRQQNELLSILMLVPVIAALSVSLSRLFFAALIDHK